jgi:hypothetical protein
VNAVVVFLFLIAVAAPVAASTFDQAFRNNSTVTKMPQVGEIKIQQDPISVVTKFNAALNMKHDPNAVLAFFTDDAVVKILPEDVPGGIIAVGKIRIGLWLQEIMTGQGGLQAAPLSEYNVTGNIVTWTEAFWIERYGTVAAIAEPLRGVAEAVVKGDKLSSFTITLTSESVAKLRHGQSGSPQNRMQLTIATSGFEFGLIVLGLIFPAAAMYYISRVRSLFAAIPRLERPWILLLAGVASLFLATLLILLRGFATIPSWDAIYSVVLVVAAFFILASMVFMKRVWTIAGSE